MPYARGAHGNRVHYRVFGDEQAPPVVLVQGLGLSGRFWFQIPEELAGAGYRVVVPDNRGTGRSELPRRPWRMGAMADDVAAVLDSEEIERATVVGISMGGMIAQHVAIRHADRLEGLVLMATTCGLPHGRLPDPATIGLLLRSPFARGAEANRNMVRLLLPREEAHRAKELFADWPKAFAEEGARPRTFFMQLGAVLLHSTGGKLGDIRCPTVVVHGDRDVLVPHRNAEIIARRIPSARLESLRGVAHAIPSLDRDAVRRAVELVRGEGVAGEGAASPTGSAA